VGLVTNRQLFSAVYLRELQQGKHAADVLDGARQTICEWRDEYTALDEASNRSTYVKQCLSALGVATSPREERDGLTLYSDIAKAQATGLCLVVENADLGSTVKGAHPQARLVRELRKTSLQWGMLTNGIQWRLCHASAPAPYEVYLEADLDGLLHAQALNEFLLFHRFFGAEAFGVADGRGGLDRYLAESDKRTEAIERHLKSQVEPILQKLCMGFVEDEAAGSYSAESLQVIYKNAIYLLYRILFLFYAEARDLLPIEHPAYRAASLAALVESARQHQREGAHDADPFSLWKRLTRLCAVVDDGDAELGVSAYNGGLFSDTEKPYLKSHKIRDDYLAAALFALGFEATKQGFQPIDYRDLSVRHLGTLYEGLLEYRLNLVEQEPRIVRESGGKRTFVPLSKAGAVKKGEIILEVGQVYFADDKGERKASGSYYTPEDVVQYIVSYTVTPKLVERRQPFDRVRDEVEQERAVAATLEKRQQLERYADAEALKAVEKGILTLRILDLAMGSGHFLVAAAQTITDFIVETLNATDWPNEDISSDPLFWKRRVVERCIYGVDKNPLAHELAKLSLWIASASAGKPLTFLDHHLKQGNSLYGTPLSRLANLPTAKKQSDDPLFRVVREQTISSVLKELADITLIDSDTIEVIKHKGEVNKTVENTVERLRMVADMWLATLFGLKTEGDRTITDEEYARFLNDLTTNYSEEAWQALVDASPILQAARRIAEENEFFHWELEFPDSVVGSECRFDAVVKNPPYVRTQANVAITTLYNTANCGDLYAWLFEKALQVASDTGNVGTVVPLSLMFSRDFKSLRTVILNRKGLARFANFDNNPDSVFPTYPGSRNSQRATVALLGKGNELRVETTNLLRWAREERPNLFNHIRFADVTEIATVANFPKLGDKRLTEFSRRLYASTRTTRQLCSTMLSENQKDYEADYFLIIPRAVRYFLSALPVRLDRNKVLTLTFHNAADRDLAFILLNSNVHYWHWIIFGDGFATNVETVASFPVPCLPSSEVSQFSRRLFDALEECATSHGKLGEQIPNYNFNRRIDILLDIDEWIVRHIAPDINLPRDIFAQYKSNSFLHPLDLNTIMGTPSEDIE
jgi:hypothetical protein